jgi:hypothetical protein
MNPIVLLAKNKHLTGAVIAMALIHGALMILPIWITGHDAQFKQTADALHKLALIYGLLATQAASPVAKNATTESQANSSTETQNNTITK